MWCCNGIMEYITKMWLAIMLVVLGFICVIVSGALDVPEGMIGGIIVMLIALIVAIQIAGADTTKPPIGAIDNVYQYQV